MNGNVPAALSTSMGMEKKPFTYLPGGIDFSELKSPKMQKRINKHQQGGNKAYTPFGNGNGASPKPEAAPTQMRGSSLPRSMGSSTPSYTTQKPLEFKKEGSISRLLSWTDPDDPPQPSPTKTTANQGPPPLPYNPYAPKNKPVDDSVINYNGRQQRQPTSITSLPMHNLANQVAS